jgi:hypothetical protein
MLSPVMVIHVDMGAGEALAGHRSSRLHGGSKRTHSNTGAPVSDPARCHPTATHRIQSRNLRSQSQSNLVKPGQTKKTRVNLAKSATRLGTAEPQISVFCFCQAEVRHFNFFRHIKPNKAKKSNPYASSWSSCFRFRAFRFALFNMDLRANPDKSNQIQPWEFSSHAKIARFCRPSCWSRAVRFIRAIRANRG